MSDTRTETVKLTFDVTVAVPFADMAERIVRRQLGNDSRITNVELAVDLGWCAWCEEAQSPIYLEHRGHDDECPFDPSKRGDTMDPDNI